MKLAKPFRGAPKGAAFARDYQAGDECPPELVRAARAAGALVPETKTVPKVRNKPQPKLQNTVKKADASASKLHRED